ncbi:MAG TPA: DUF3828 domain-containing protein [Bryobacteraceae bacterium]|nr:DUF3828 domain-containing protein [Bryobacteraceae bacterium]
MRRASFALAALVISSVCLLSAASRIDDPAKFVADVYRRLIADTSYEPADDIYSARLAKLIRDDRRRAKGEVGCLDFVFWVNGQDWKITKLAITSADQGADRKTVIAKFRNLGDPQEIHFDFVRTGGRWLLDDAHSEAGPRWTLSQILKCAP